MKILGYGEDALTLWALQNRLIQILAFLDDPSGPPECKIFFRPSFGRRGGSGSAQFGEFDFILFTRICIYLGESKWDRSPELCDTGLLELRPEQLLRHRVFAFYVREWAFGQYDSWDRFVRDGSQKLLSEGINKPLAPADSLLASNLKKVLGIIRGHFLKEPQIIDLLLYLHDGSKKPPPSLTGGGFRLVPVDYSSAAEGNFIPIEI